MRPDRGALARGRPERTSVSGGDGSPGGPRVVAAQTGRRAARSGALWGLVFGAYVAASSLGYATTYPTPAARAKLASSFGTNAGLAALIGPARHLDTVAGFTSWRATGVLTVVGAIWGLFLATRLLRGEEDAGRSELILSGPMTRRGAFVQAMAGLGGGLVSLWAVTAALTVASGRSAKVNFSAGGSLYLATALVAGAVMFVTIGALLAQLAANRRQANVVGGAVIGVAYALRMIADSTAGAGWLRWVSPIGWVEELRPLVGPHPAAFIPIALLSATASVLAVGLASQRDLGAGVLPNRDTPASHVALLRSPFWLAVRQIRGTFIGWAIGMSVFGLVIGLVANAAASAVSSSAAVERAVVRLGGHAGGGAAAVQGYLGIALLEAAALVAFAAAAQIGSAREEEATSRLDRLLACPVRRVSWLAGKLAVAGLFVLSVSVLAGLFTWVGVLVQGGGANLASLVGAGVNMAPASLFVLGLGTLAFGLWPRRAPLFAYAVVGWSFLVQFLATAVKANHVLLDTSVLAHLRPAPAAQPDWVAAFWLLVLGVVAAAGGAAAFQRRDLAGD